MGSQTVAKHYLLNDDETNRSTVDKKAGIRTIQEIYLVPWGRAIEAGLSGAMCAMNMVNGSWSCSNSELLNAELKGRFDFSGELRLLEHQTNVFCLHFPNTSIFSL